MGLIPTFLSLPSPRVDGSRSLGRDFSHLYNLWVSVEEVRPVHVVLDVFLARPDDLDGAVDMLREIVPMSLFLMRLSSER